MSRPFNQKAYDAFDMKNKKALVEMMTKKGYHLVGNINEENYKKYDVKFSNGVKEISFENETRINFTKIRDIFSTIHIPIRKENTLADYYIVWKPEMDEFFLIDMKKIEEYKKNIITLMCDEYNETNRYIDSFIDIPKNQAILYKKINGNWKNIKI